MTGQDKPILLLKRKLVGPVERAEEKLDLIAAALEDKMPQIAIDGVFVMGVAAFEIMLTDMLTYFFTVSPRGLPKFKREFTKEQLLNGRCLEDAIERTVRGHSYERVDKMVAYVCETIAIDPLPSEIVRNLADGKDKRNLLMHDDALDDWRVPGARVTVNLSYVKGFTATLRTALTHFSTEILTKYEKYTRARALRELWAYLFESPIMPFEKYWKVDETADRTTFTGVTDDRHLATSEQMLLQVWIDHYGEQTLEPSVRLLMRHLDSSNREKALFLLSVAPDLIR